MKTLSGIQRATSTLAQKVSRSSNLAATTPTQVEVQPRQAGQAACPSKAKFCPNADARAITREEHEDARQVARDIAKTKQYAVLIRLRKKFEMLFVHLKRILGLGMLRLRGPCGANDEFLLAATAQNLRKLAKILPAPQQMRKA
jgi:hypothetical protein